MKRLILLSGALCLVFMLVSCETFILGRKVNLKFSVNGVANTPSASSFAERSSARSRDVTPNTGTWCSFTPDTLKIRVRSAIIAEEMTYKEGSGLTAGSVNQVNLVPTPKEITLEPGSSTLALDDVVDIPATAPAQFGGILLCYGEGNAVEGTGVCNVKISGSFSLEGTTYTVTDLEAPLSTTGIGLNMPTVVDTTTGQVPVVRVIFDLDSCVFAAKSATRPTAMETWVKVPGTSDVWIQVQDLIFVPYVGNADPTVRKYKVELTDALYSPDQWYLKLVTYFDGDIMSGAGFQMVSKTGATVAPGGHDFGPGMLYYPDISEVSAGIWKIDSTVYASGPRAQIAFPAFDLNGGSGTLEHANQAHDNAVEEIAYTATELE